MTMLIPIRDDTPYHRFPVVTLSIIGVNIWVFLTVPITEPVVFEYGAIPCDIMDRCERLSAQLQESFPTRHPLLSLFTSMFVHGNLAHIAGNMLYLWVFGNNVEDRLGHVRYALFYGVCGVAAAFTHIFIEVGSAIPMIGASGAVSGVLGAYLLMYPRARVIALVPFFLFLPVSVSAGFLLGFWFVLQLFYGVAGLGLAEGPGVAFFAHVGGFVAGWVLVRILAPGARRPPPGDRWLSERR